MWTLVLLLISILTLGLTLLILKVKVHQNYFKKRNVKYLKSVPFLGFLKDAFLSRTSVYENVLDVYNLPEFKDEPFFGAFLFAKPALIIKDAELIKKILITDFASFGSRHAGSDVHDNVGYNQLFMSPYSIWKQVRPKFSKFFSQSRLKNAFALIEGLGNNLTQRILRDMKFKGPNIDLKHLSDIFFVDVTALIGFSVETHSLENSQNDFQKASDSLFIYNFWRGYEWMSIMFWKNLMQIFGFKLLTNVANEFFENIGPQIIGERVKSGERRNDFIDCIVDLRDEIKGDHKNHTVDEILTAQIVAFFTANETSTNIVSFAIYEMARNPDMQAKLRAEIKDTLLKNDGKFTFEAMTNPSEMPYLHAIINETTRIYPVLSMLDRECINPEGVSLEPFSDFKIPKGMPILVPIYGMFLDEKVYPNPNKFDPERFSPENIHNIPSTFIPFGVGPRYCVGEKLGWIQTKFAICTYLKDFHVEMAPETPREITITKKAIVFQAEKPLIVKFVEDPLLS